MGKNRLLIVFTGVIILLLLASCTYDYFKDETNYQVYVPEVVDNKVSDCRVLVYDETGTLVGARYEAAPWKDPITTLCPVCLIALSQNCGARRLPGRRCTHL